MEHDLYDRQRRVPGWQQERLTAASAAIVGSDWLAGCCALYLACLGVGRIYLLDSAHAAAGERFFFPLQGGGARVQSWADWLTRLGFPNQIIARCMNPIFGSRALLPPADVILSTIQDPVGQETLALCAAERGIPLVWGATSPQSGAMSVLSPSTASAPFLPLVWEPGPEGALSSLVIAALMAEEARRCLLPLPEDRPLPAGTVLQFAPAHSARFVAAPGRPADPATLPGSPSALPRRILLVGAGALGTFAGLGLAMQEGVETLGIVDPDFIEATNGNRQPFYLRSLGDGKAITLAAHLWETQPDLHVEHFGEGVRPDHFDLFRPDLVLCCTDTFASRHLAHQQCLSRGIPMITGGTSALSAHLEVYMPGKTACLNCAYGLAELAEREARERADPAHCQQTPEPSIVTTNAVVGSLMAQEAGSLHAPLQQMLHYDARLRYRFHSGYARPPCDCHIASQSHILRQEEPNS